MGVPEACREPEAAVGLEGHAGEAPERRLGDRRIAAAIRQLDGQRRRRPLAGLQVRGALLRVDPLIVPAQAVVPDRAPGYELERGRLVDDPRALASRHDEAEGHAVVEGAGLDRVGQAGARVAGRHTRPVAAVDRPRMDPARRIALIGAVPLDLADRGPAAQVDAVDDQPQGRASDHGPARPADRERQMATRRIDLEADRAVGAGEFHPRTRRRQGRRGRQEQPRRHQQARIVVMARSPCEG